MQLRGDTAHRRRSSCPRGRCGTAGTARKRDQRRCALRRVLRRRDAHAALVVVVGVVWVFTICRLTVSHKPGRAVRSLRPYGALFSASKSRLILLQLLPGHDHGRHPLRERFSRVLVPLLACLGVLSAQRHSARAILEVLFRLLRRWRLVWSGAGESAQCTLGLEHVCVRLQACWLCASSPSNLCLPARRHLRRRRLRRRPWTNRILRIARTQHPSAERCLAADQPRSARTLARPQRPQRTLAGEGRDCAGA